MERAIPNVRPRRKLLNSLRTNSWPGTCCGWMETKAHRHPWLGSKTSLAGKQTTVKNQKHETVEFGELVLAIYDEAAQYSDNPREVSLSPRRLSRKCCGARPSRSVRCLLPCN